MKGFLNMTDQLFPYDRKCETLSLQEIRSLQETLLRKQLSYCMERSPFYQKKFAGYDRKWETFPLECLRELPFTEKEDLAVKNDEFCCIPSREIGEIVFTSGTTGEPTKIIYSSSDMQRLRYNEQRSFTAAGINEEDTVLLTCTSDRCFIAGMAYYQGARSVGAAAVRSGLNSIESHLDILERVRPTVIVGVPSFLKHLALAAQKKGLTGSVRKLMCIGEPVRDKDFALAGLGRQIAELWDAQVHSTYASSEIVTSFCECSAMQGGHLLPDLVIAEIVDEQGNVLPAGEKGELVLTQLNCTGMPLIRFKTGDITFLTDAPCSCGRKTPRLGPILGRKNQLLKCKGTSIYPQVIYSVLETSPLVRDFYLEISGENLSDKVDAFIVLNDPACTDIRELSRQLHTQCRMNIPVHLVSMEELQHKVFGQSRKPKRFHDLRKS